MSISIEKLKKQMADDGVRFVLTQFVDIHGAPKVKMAPVEALDELIESGAGFAGGALWGMGQGAHSHDMMARVDPETYTPLGWQPGTARFACDLYVDGKAHPYCPRANLKRVLASAADRGYAFNVGVEPEHYLVTRTADGGIAPWDPGSIDTLDKPCYDFKAVAVAFDYLQEVTRTCNALGWGVYQTDHEDGNGQYEVNFRYADAKVTADRHTFFKMATSQIARKYGAIATYMAKPFGGRTGSGAHLHYHLADATTGKNLFEEHGDRRGLGLSGLAYAFIAGVFKHARALCAVGSPTVNCYKRLLSGGGLTSGRSGFTWTPAFISYGGNNRTQMIRVCGPGHIEDRSVSSACNPYLIFAAYLAAGLDGIDRGLDPGEPNATNLYAAGQDAEGVRLLPQSLREAIDALERDEVVGAALGPIRDEFIALKRQEWDDYHRQVSPWEIERYLSLH